MIVFRIGILILLTVVPMQSRAECGPYTYYSPLNLQIQCAPCPSLCQVCRGPTGCLKCAKYHYYNQTINSCEPCPANCRICHSSIVCSVCADNFYIDFETMACRSCPPGCLSCVDGVCTSYARNNMMAKFHKVYDQRLLDFEGQVCALNCQICLPDGSCIKCLEGYFKNEGSCKECLQGCEVCNSPNTCLKCLPGYYLSQDRCHQCSKGCKRCSSTGCLETNDYYGVTPGGQVFQCIRNCIYCVSSSECIACKNGFAPSFEGLQCRPCNQGCDKCIKSYDTEKCFQCSSGYYMDLDRTCKICGKGCEKCVGTSHCSQCGAGYYLTQGRRCRQCGTGCAYCLDLLGCLKQNQRVWPLEQR